MKKQMTILLIVVGMLIGAGIAKADFPKAFVSTTDVVDVLIIGNVSNSGDRLIQNSLNTFLQQERSIGAISRYNYNNLTSPFVIGNPPSNQFDWMKWHVMNVKLGKWLDR